MQTKVFYWLVTGSTFGLSLQEPVGPPTPKRPRGRPKGSKNKGTRSAQKVETDPKYTDIYVNLNYRIVTPCFYTISFHYLFHS